MFGEGFLDDSVGARNTSYEISSNSFDLLNSKFGIIAFQKVIISISGIINRCSGFRLVAKDDGFTWFGELEYVCFTIVSEDFQK